MSSQKHYKWARPLSQAEEKLEERRQTELLKEAAFRMFDVHSSNIRRLGYDPSWKRMRVVFMNNTAYQYFDVNEVVWNEVRLGLASARYPNEHAPSVGAALDKFVKKKNIRYIKE